MIYANSQIKKSSALILWNNSTKLPFISTSPVKTLIIIGIRTIMLEKARVIDPFGYAGLTLLGKIRLTLAGEIKMTPVEATAGEFFCSFGDPSPGTAGVYLKTLQI